MLPVAFTVLTLGRSKIRLETSATEVVISSTLISVLSPKLKSSISVTLPGITTVPFSAGVPETVMLSKLSHPSNAYCFIVRNVFGSSTDFRFLQLWNALSSKSVTPAGIFTLSIFFPENADSPMEVTPAGISIFDSSPL